MMGRESFVSSTESATPSDITMAADVFCATTRRNRSKSPGSRAALTSRASVSDVQSSRSGMMSPRLSREVLTIGSAESMVRLSSAPASPASLTPTQVPNPCGSTGKTAVRCCRPWTAGGRASARSRRSSRLQPRRNPSCSGTMVTVHTRGAISSAAASRASGQAARAPHGREWRGAGR